MLNQPATALDPRAPDDGDAGRQQRGLSIAAIVSIKKNKLGYSVPSQSGAGSYVVNLDSEPFCSCPDFEKRQLPCKHIYGVQYLIQREEYPDGDILVPQPAKVTYQQDWAAYNAAQVYEGEHFLTLLHELCNTVPQPPASNGRPRLPISDVLVGLAVKVYSTMSTRRAMTGIRDAQTRGLLETVPSFTSVFRYMENPEMKGLLKSLIERSALPLATVESKFAADSSGFSTSVYHRWFDHKHGREIKEAKWVKAHIFTGVQTNIVTVAEVTDVIGNDSPHLVPFLNATNDSFNIQEVSADKAYLSKGNLRAIQGIGATPYIPFKTNSVEFTPKHKKDEVWSAMFHYYNLHRAEFLIHYHQRSNVETTFSMIKAKFGGAVRSKTPVAQTNEVLLKILVHNICVLIQSMYELGITPLFTGGIPSNEGGGPITVGRPGLN